MLQATQSQQLTPAAAALLDLKQWKHKDLIRQFLSPEYDEARYLATTMAQSSSSVLEQLSGLLVEISGEIHSVVVTHHPALLSINSHILLIEGEVQTVVRRVASLKAALARIQTALMAPYEKLGSAVQQLHAVQTTAEYIRQAVRVLNLCDKLQQHTTVATGTVITSTPSSRASSSAIPPLRNLVKSATVLHDIHEVFGSINLNGIAAVDAQMPFLNSVSEMLHNQGRRVLYEAMRAGDSATTAAPTQVNQVDLDYVVQMFYNMAPNSNVTPQLKQLCASSKRGSRLSSPDDASTEDGIDSNGGVELVIVLDELVHTYLEQLRAALRKILDIAGAQALSIQEAAKRKGKKPITTGGAPPVTPSTPASLRSTLWDRLDSFTDLAFTLTVQVWTLQRILHEKRDLVYNAAPGVPLTDIYRLQRAILNKRQAAERAQGKRKSGATNGRFESLAPVAAQDEEEVSLLHTFWNALCALLRSEFEPISESSASPSSTPASAHSSHNFLKTIFTNEYPRFHNLFERSVFDRIAKYCDQADHATATATASSTAGLPITPSAAAAAAAAFANGVAATENPPPLLTHTHRHVLLSSFLPFFQLYLSRTLTLLTAPLTLMFPAHESNGSVPTVPSRSDVHAFVSVVQASLESLADVRDEEVQVHVAKAVAKAVSLFTQHTERMLHMGVDRDIFSSSHLSLSQQVEQAAFQPPSRHPTPTLSHSHSGSTSALSQAQRTNLDLFAILCQVEKEFTPHELQRRYSGLYRGAPGSTPTPALAVLAKCLANLRQMQGEVLSILLHTVSRSLQATLYGVVPDDDASILASTASISPDGSAAFQSFRRRFVYCVHVLFPMYHHHLNGGTAASTLAPVDAQARQALWAEKFLSPLNSQLIHAYVHVLSLHPLTLASSPSVPSDSLRSHVLNELTLFEASMQQMMKQPKRAARLPMPLNPAVGALLDSLQPSAQELPPIELLHGFKSLLFAKESSAECMHLYASRSVDAVTLLHFLFGTCSVHAAAGVGAGASQAAAAALPNTQPHRLLQMRVEEYSNYIETHNLAELYDLFNKVYLTLESRIPSIPSGPAGRAFVQDTYPKLALALRVLTRTSK